MDRNECRKKWSSIKIYSGYKTQYGGRVFRDKFGGYKVEMSAWILNAVENTDYDV